MTEETAMVAIAHSIQLAVAPVFLLSGIAAILVVMTNRLARIVDRARIIEARTPPNPYVAGAIRDELDRLSRRAKLISVSITLSTVTALLVAAVIALLFISAFLSFDATVPVALTFTVAMLAFVVALLAFLREVLLATTNLRFGPHADA
jgi:hypothetical protein